MTDRNGSSYPNGTTRIIGNSPVIQKAIALARQFAASHLPILLVGETGTGKELFAQEIHRWSGRTGPVIDVNCGALPRELVEGELFGHRRGSFTGAAVDSSGLIAEAHRGTLFLDELSCLPIEGQVKLLRVLETREIRRVGDTSKRVIDFRLIGAAQGGLMELVRQQTFRMDLFQRVSGLVIHLPPLASRLEDVVPLAERFLGARAGELDSGCRALLERYSWPGNIRELRTVIERALTIADGRILDPAILLEAVDLGQGDARSMAVSHHAGVPEEGDERRRILDAGERYGWSAERMSAALRMSRATLYRRLRLLRISLGRMTRQGTMPIR